ncbi:transglycosylase domain-containing protein [Paenibacillus endoradicis]|uniref:transglycosylase domain-containing protein n=1 Tax=Paenibacillus endoradicis TaxID=2972487 RepID=UPI002159B01B|nr:PBP1A family penicillin-binding protein [Paenibacillus endoradicis]MCR8658904.1 PBP1A family penicillin-binding protein [Paenibacillus endoradicis]
MRKNKNWLQHRLRRTSVPAFSERYISFMLKLNKWLRRTIIMLIVMMTLILGSLFYMKQQDLPVSNISQSSQLVDRNGVLIDYFHTGVNRRAVSLDEISPYVIEATLSIEDKRFYSHFGFDIKGLVRAVVVNVQTLSAKQGASTLTQQLARNLYLTHEKTFERKIKEALYTTQLEMKFSKDEILEMYLNQIYYGHGAYGIEAAAQYYFNKSAKDLDLAESSLLAGIPKGPTYYSPYNNMLKAKNRQELILQAMVDNSYITTDEKQVAYEKLLTFGSQEKDSSNNEASYFKDYVIQSAVHDLGIDEQLLYEGGVTIYSTLDMNMQEIAEQKVQEGLLNDSEQQAALIAIDPRNGHIKAMVGGKNYNDNQFNRTTATTRQPGSTFKPFVYLTALQQQTLTVMSTFKSEPTVFTYDEGRKTYEPQNYADKYVNDFIAMRRAIASSDNIYAVNTLMTVGADAVVETAHQLGIHSDLTAVPSLALGTSPVSPLEMAASYGVFANQGIYNKPISILKIVNKQGKTIYEADYTPTSVITPPEAFLVTSLLEGVFETGGTAHRVQNYIHRPIAGKSGTTPVDAWMIGYTPELSTAVWVGYDKDRYLTVAEAYRAAPIFAHFMEEALQSVPPKMFPIPEDIVTVYIDEDTGLLASEACPSDHIEYFLVGTEPQNYCETELDVTGNESEPKELPKVDIDEHPSYRTWWNQLKKWWDD